MTSCFWRLRSHIGCVAAVFGTLLAPSGSPPAAPPPSHIVMGVALDGCSLELPSYGDRELFLKGSAWAGYQLSRQLGLQIQGDTWQHEVPVNILTDNARDIHWHGWSAVPCVSYSPRGGHAAILAGAGVGFADFDAQTSDLTRLALLLGAQYALPVGSAAVVVRVQVQRLSAAELHNPKTFSAGLGFEWY